MDNEDKKPEDQKPENEDQETPEEEEKDTHEDEEKKKEEARLQEEARLRELEIENARLKGMAESQVKATPAPAVESEYDKFVRTKSTVNSDSQSLSDDDFQEKYKMTKGEAHSRILSYELEHERNLNRESMALLRAENVVAKKYGDKYSKYQNEIEKSIEDLAPSVRQDPKRLAEHMDFRLKALLSDDKENTPPPPQKKKEAPMGRRIVDSGFEPPNTHTPEQKPKQKKSEDIPDEFKPIASKFGIETESERQKYKDEYIDVEYGNNQVLTKDGVKTKQT